MIWSPQVWKWLFLLWNIHYAVKPSALTTAKLRWAKKKKRTASQLFPASNPNSKHMKCKKLCFVRAISSNYIHVQNHTKVIFIAILISFKHNCSQKANIYIEQSRWLLTYPNRDPKASNDVHCKMFESKRING